ncbi:MAG: UPF0175 family protein [Desulfotignum sp.]|nr:UPF0175 family protein [Desulfotignum sp.]MCF8114566.1 UPF0175 family protein [Desulfotignum sp.]
METKLMNTGVLELPLDVLALPGIPPEDLANEAQFMLALKLFEIGRLISGISDALERAV